MQLNTSRVRPPPEFAGLLGNGVLVPIGPAELPFSEEESFAVQRRECEERPLAERLSLGQMRTPHELSRGWPAGLKLLLQLDAGDVASLHRGTLTDQSALFDYLANEIFQRQTPGVRALLLQLAHLPRMAVNLAVALSGSAEAGVVLSTLANDGLLTSQHGVGTQAEYEFHPLLRQFLLQKAPGELGPATLAQVEQRAAQLLADDGAIDAAAQLLVSGAHWDALQQLVLAHAPTLVARGWQRTLAGWLAALPAARRDDDPWLAYWQGESQVHFDPPAAQASFAHAYGLFRARNAAAGAYRAWCASVELICLEWADFSQLDYWLDEAEGLQASYGDPDPELVTRFTASMFGVLAFRRPDTPAIHDWSERLLRLIEQCPDANQRILFGCNLYLHYVACTGQSSLVDELTEWLDPPASTALEPVFDVLWHGLCAMRHWFSGDNAQAAAVARRALAVAREQGLRLWESLLCALDTYASLNDGDVAAGRRALQEFGRTLDRRRKVDLAHFLYLSALAHLLADEGGAALAAIEAANALADRFGGTHQHALGRLAQAEALHAVGRTHEARALVDRARQIGYAMKSDFFAYQVSLTEALFALDAAETDACATALRRAFTLGSAHDYRNYQYFRPAVMSRFCAFALEHDVVPDYARRLIHCRRLQPPEDSDERWPWPIRVQTLGRFGLVVDDQPLAEASRGQTKPIVLLQALIALGGRDVPIAELVSVLWTEDRDSSANGTTSGAANHARGRSAIDRGAFDISLSRLRRVLGGDALLVDQQHLSLNPNRCWVDLWHCQRTVRNLQTLIDHQPAVSAVRLASLARDVLTRYRGDFLPRVRDARWALVARGQLRLQVVDGLAEVARRLEAADDRWQAISIYQRAVDIDPVSETLYRGWMRCLLAQGELAEALRVYQRCRAALAHRLGVLPSAETESLHAMIVMRQSPASDPR